MNDDIKLVSDFETQDEYICYVMALASQRKDVFERYLSLLRINSNRLIDKGIEDIGQHVCMTYMLAVCRTVEFSSQTIH